MKLVIRRNGVVVVSVQLQLNDQISIEADQPSEMDMQKMQDAWAQREVKR